MKFWTNFLGYEIVWFIAVFGAGHGSALPGFLGAAVFVTWQIIMSDQRTADMRLVGVALVCGVLVDGGLSFSGWAHYAAMGLAVPTGGAPLWILALWAAFAMTLNHSMAWLRRRLWLACVLGLVGGPLAYWGVARGWQAMVFEPPTTRATIWLAIGWAVALPLLAGLARRWSARGKANQISCGGTL